MFGIEQKIPEIAPSIIFNLFGFPIANTTLLAFLIVILFVFLVLKVQKFSLKPTNNFQVITEIVFEKIYDFVKNLMGNHPHFSRIFPIVLAIMLYLVVANLITLLPGITSITWENKEIFRTPTTDLNTVLGLSLASILFIHFSAVKTEGVIKYLSKFFKFKEVYLSFKKGISSGLLSLVEFFIGLLDIISEFAKIVSLALRLFGNIYAGEILLIIISGFVAYIIPALWNIYGSFVGILQGVVFASLVAVFYSLTVEVKKDKNNKKENN